MTKRIDDLQYLIERQEKCRAKHIESVIVRERYRGMHVWDGVVEAFQLEGHRKAKRAYASARPATTKNDEPHYTIVVGLPPVNSAQDAVKATIVKDFKELVRIAEQKGWR